MCLVKVMISNTNKVTGHQNPDFTPKAMNFFIALDTMSINTANFMAANLFGTSLLSIQRFNSRFRGYALIICDWDTIAARIAARIGFILSESDDPNSTVYFSLCFYGTKFPPKLQISVGHMEIIISVFPNDMIDISE